MMTMVAFLIESSTTADRFGGVSIKTHSTPSRFAAATGARGKLQRCLGIDWANCRRRKLAHCRVQLVRASSTIGVFSKKAALANKTSPVCGKSRDLRIKLRDAASRNGGSRLIQG